MADRKQIKKLAGQLVKRHYALLIILCAISVFFGTEFTVIVDNAQVLYDGLTGRPTELNTVGYKVKQTVNQQLIDDYIEDNIRNGNENAARRLRELKESTDLHSVLGRRRGALATILNTVNSGQLTVTAGLALHSMIHSQRLTAIIMILLSLLVTMLVWIFLKNVYRAILRRAVMEMRTYEVLPLNHLMHLKMVRRWSRSALCLLWLSFWQELWDLTVIGGVIKRYSYFCVPFITAENPDIRPREAMNLSKRMMDGHKMECFKLEMSFLGWMVLGFFTFGVTEVLWSIPYRIAAFAEYYAFVRQEAKEKALEGAERLNDDVLFAPAPEEVLAGHYKDIIKREDLIDEDIVVLSPLQKFFAGVFGLWTATLDEKKVYSRQDGLRQQMKTGRLELHKKAYPQRLNPLWQREAAALTGRVNYLSPVTIWSLIMIFFTFSMIGWLWEVSLHLITDGRFVNRGALHGPWLPIYGAGVALICVLLFKFRTRPALEALMITILCGFVEYFTSFAMEVSKGMRWWDYTGYYLNLNGRICAEGLAVFTLGGMAAIYLLVPVIDAAVVRIRPEILITVCVILLACFASDLVYSHFVPNAGKGITDYGEEQEVPDEAGLEYHGVLLKCASPAGVFFAR